MRSSRRGPKVDTGSVSRPYVPRPTPTTWRRRWRGCRSAPSSGLSRGNPSGATRARRECAGGEGEDQAVGLCETSPCSLRSLRLQSPHDLIFPLPTVPSYQHDPHRLIFPPSTPMLVGIGGGPSPNEHPPCPPRTPARHPPSQR